MGCLGCPHPTPPLSSTSHHLSRFNGQKWERERAWKIFVNAWASTLDRIHQRFHPRARFRFSLASHLTRILIFYISFAISFSLDNRYDKGPKALGNLIFLHRELKDPCSKAPQVLCTLLALIVTISLEKQIKLSLVSFDEGKFFFFSFCYIVWWPLEQIHHFQTWF